MATRMKQRRGTAAQWISTNSGQGPILEAGEIGYESDTNKFKIGDGTNHWLSLPYFLDEESLGGSLGDYLTVDDLGQPLKAASLDADGNIPVAQLGNIIDGAPGLLDTLNELSAALGNDADFAANLTTTLGNKQDKVTGVSDTEIGYLANVTSDIQTQIDGKLASADLDEAAQEAVNTALVAGTGLDKTYDDLNNTITLNIDSTVATTTYVDDQIAAFDALPTQTGNDGKFLQTTGSGTQWAEVDLTTKQDSLTVGDGLDLTGATLSVNPAEMTTKVVEGVSGQSYGLVGTSQYLDTKTGNGYNTEIELDILAVESQLDTDGYAKQTDISNAITNLNLATTYDAYGAASTAETNANNYTDTSISGLSGNATAVVAGNLDVLTGTGIAIVSNAIEVDFQELDTRYDALNAADNAEQDANLYTDNAISALNLATTYDAKGAAATVQTNLDNHALDASTHGVTSSIVGTDDSQTLTNKTISYANNTVTVQVANISDLTATASELNILDGVTVTASDINQLGDLIAPLQGQLDDKAPLASPSFTGTISGVDLELSGNLTVDGTFSSVPTETLTVTNPMIYMGDGNTANINDLGMVGSHTINSVYSHTGLVKDATDGKWKLFTGVTDEPTTTINFSQATLDTLVAATFEGNVTGDVAGNADTATALETARNIAGQSFDGTADINIAPTDLTGVTATAAQINILDGATLSTTELNYVDGVTSSIQTQIDTKLATSTASSTYAPINSPTFTGTVSGVTKSMVGLGNVDNTADADKPVSTDVQAELDLKANLNAPTFTGSVVLPSTTAIGDVSATEIGYVNGVTSAIQTQLDGKASLSSPVLVTPDLKGRVEILEDDSNGLPYNPPVLDIGGRLVLSTSGITFEGNTANDYETTISVVDPTADRTINFPNVSGTVVTTGNIADALPSQSLNGGKYLTTNGTSASWATLSVPITTGTFTSSSPAECLIDLVATSGFTSIDYFISIKQGSKIRTSKITVQTDGSSIDYVEYGVLETGGTMSGVQVYAVYQGDMLGSYSRLNIIVTDADTTPYAVKFSKVAI